MTKTKKRTNSPRKVSSAKKQNYYFNEDTQRSIVEYQEATDFQVKNKIYKDKIYPAFSKLVENLINIHRFTALHELHESLSDDCISFLFETLNKFDNSRGTNAFSYFNIIAKRHLIIKVKQKNARTRKLVSIDDPISLDVADQQAIEDYAILPAQDVLYEQRSEMDEIIDMLYLIREQSRTENELVVMNSIITIFENVDEIDILTKSSVFLYIRELSGLSPKQLTTTLQIIKKNYRELRRNKLSSVDIFNML